MNIDRKKIMAAGFVSATLIAGTLSTTAPARATHYIGHVILGGIIGGAIIHNNRYRQPVYQQPVYAPPPRSCYWQDIVEYDRWSRPIHSRIRVCR